MLQSNKLECLSLAILFSLALQIQMLTFRVKCLRYIALWWTLTELDWLENLLQKKTI
jgi:hypothetical protein